MAGALTANSVGTDVLDPGDALSDEEKIIGALDFLSPVDGANNALLTGIVTVTVGEDDAELTFQWYRARPTFDDLTDSTLGAAVGPAWTVAYPGDEQLFGPITILAIDKGAGATSAYALTAILTTAVTCTVDTVYVDAVLFD